MNSNPLNIGLIGEQTEERKDDGVDIEHRHVFNAFDKSRASVSKFNLLDISLAKSLNEVVESTPQVLWQAYDKYADTGEWCRLDQMRLISLDHMFRRCLSYHKNHLTFKVSNVTGYTLWLPPFRNDLESIAFQTQIFGKGKPFSPAKVTQFGNLQQDLGALAACTGPGGAAAGDFVWVNMNDIRCLDQVAEAFRLHKYARRFFTDLRGHSSISAFHDGIFASIMTVRIVCSQAHLYKIYYFSTERLLLTFEREVMQDSSNTRMKDHVALPYRDVSFSVLNARQQIDDETDDMLVQAVREEMKTSENKLLDALNVSPLLNGVVNMVMASCAGEVYESVCGGGSMFLLYEIMMQSLLASETVLEFMSRTIDYFKSQIYKQLSSKSKKNFFRENATLKSSVRMMITMVDDVLRSLNALMDKTTIEFDFVSKKMLNSWEATLCVAELEDSYRFRKICLESQLAECSVVAVSLEHQMDLTSERESKNLNLVATIFLPLTFWAGVFGMNFQVDGGYTMDILNKEKGPNLFWAICIVCVAINIVLFARSGMIDFECLTKKELRTHGDDEAFESSVVRLKKNQQRPEDVGAGPGSEFERSRKTFDISVEEKAPR